MYFELFDEEGSEISRGSDVRAVNYRAELCVHTRKTKRKYAAACSPLL